MPPTPRALLEAFWAAIGQNDMRAAGALLHDDYVLDWPQSGERVVGRANFVALNEAYPAHGPWRTHVSALVAEGLRVVSDVTVTDGTLTARAITFSEVRDGLIARQTEFWPEPFEAAAWRSRWVVR